MTRTQVAIVGAGPAGLTLAHLLRRQGVEAVVLERRTRAHVESRLRAGVLEQPTVDLLRELGLAARLDAEAMTHRGVRLRFAGATHRLDLSGLTGGRAITIYGQHELVKDLIAARLADGDPILFEVDEVELSGLDADPVVRYLRHGRRRELRCSIVAGADGFRGVTRGYLPGTVFEQLQPFAWLGILARTAPSSDELVYAAHEDGFALHSMRGPALTRQYVQVPPDVDVAAWPAERIWQTLRRRLGHGDGLDLPVGPILDVTVAAMRAVVTEPMRHGRLFLLGDAAHIVPATGAKGLNLAVADAAALSYAIGAWAGGAPAELDRYSSRCLDRVWRTQRFSVWLSQLTHRLPGEDAVDRRLRETALSELVSCPHTGAAFAERYVGQPLPTPWWWNG
ncbi:4-hydroxybenzoate 3-monooxygenase [Pilimelia columellifera]|uniref:4-hydroxybenzoate 3-monooxygenase n=1 Tax=Pilimelia columellifera subsp. columellifera TaxID=706583 RepID=A0ABN3N4M5_9ACTN